MQLNRIKVNLASKIFPYLPTAMCNFGFSGRVIIEPTNICNLRCPLCPTSQNMQRPKSYMGLDNFKRLIQQNYGYFSRVSMNFAGEPLLNPNIFEMAEYAEFYGMRTMISTNAMLLGGMVNDALNSHISSIVVCLDGATANTHEYYRVGSKFENIRENIRLLCEAKRKRQARKPIITLQFVVMRHNEHEIAEIHRLAGALGVDRLELKSVSLGSSRKHDDKWLPENEEYSRYKYTGGRLELKDPPKLCPWLKQGVILWNGDVIMCCYDFNGIMKVGNAFERPFKEIWNSSEYRHMRKAVIRKEFELCRNCQATLDYGKAFKVI